MIANPKTAQCWGSLCPVTIYLLLPPLTDASITNLAHCHLLDLSAHPVSDNLQDHRAQRANTCSWADLYSFHGPSLFCQTPRGCSDGSAGSDKCRRLPTACVHDDRRNRLPYRNPSR